LAELLRRYPNPQNPKTPYEWKINI
jgi:hypothetical protein